MSPPSKSYHSTRRALVIVHEHCPQRAYIELEVPHDTHIITAVTFTTVSRDQGWADSKAQSYTWFEVGLRRPGGQWSDLGLIRIQHNRVANPDFFEATTRWDTENPQLRSTFWLRSLRPMDVIQLIPKAVYPGWVNIIREATLEIEYRPIERTLDTQTPQRVSIPPSSYRPLIQTDQEIRLLVVEQGEQDDIIKARFGQTSLDTPFDQHVDFEALSYCWGDSADRVDILFDAYGAGECLVGISGTIERAIRRLRKPDTTLLIWIDAICINQTDLDERSRQVSIMGNIYANAMAVHIWLDEENKALKSALRVIRDIYNCHRRVCAGGSDCSCQGTRHTMCTKDFNNLPSKHDSSFAFLNEVFNYHVNTTSSFNSNETEAAGGEGNAHLSYLMQSFFQQPWFQRVWVVQEATLSRYQTLVHYAEEVIGWDEVLFVNELLMSTHFDGQAPNMRGQFTMPVLWNTLADATPHRVAPTNRSGRCESGTKASGDDPKSLTILQLLQAGLSMKATDKRDKLFALLPFGQETKISIPQLLQPDYSKPLSHVRADFTRWWINEYCSLDILSSIHCHPRRAWQRTLSDLDSEINLATLHPTWAIEFEGYSQWSRMNLLAQFPFLRASSNSVPERTLLQSPSTTVQGRHSETLSLRLLGFEVASIIAIAHPCKSMVHPYIGTKESPASTTTPSIAPVADLPTVYHHLIDPSGYTGNWSHPGNSKKADEMGSEIRNMIFDDHVYAHAGYFPPPSQDAIRIAEGKTICNESGYERFIQTCELPSCIDQCFFVASGGFHGLCPWATRQGDIVVVLLGAKTPFLLRPTSLPEMQLAKEHNLQIEYELIGECFVDSTDLMNGKWMEEIIKDSETKLFQLV